MKQCICRKSTQKALLVNSTLELSGFFPAVSRKREFQSVLARCTTSGSFAACINFPAGRLTVTAWSDYIISFLYLYSCNSLTCIDVPS